MAAELLQFDPTSEDAANSPLTINDSSYKVMAYAWPAPPLNVLYASSVDTEGEIPASRRYSNRQISLTIRMTDTTGNLLSALQAKVTKIAREGGTLKRTMKNGDVIVFDLLASDQFDPKFDVLYHAKDYLEVEVQFAAKPFGRGAEVTLSAHNETSLPCLTFTETAITGDVPALGRLTITEADNDDQAFVIWGLQSRYYDSSSDAALFFQAEGRTPLGTAATAVGPTGASGAGSNVVSHTNLPTSLLAVLSTQGTGGGNHLKHVGDYSVFARVQVPATNAGTVSVALEWAEGDFRSYTRNSSADLDPNYEGAWLLVDLGQVHLHQVAAGTQRWEGRVLAKSTVSTDDIHIDCLMLVPVSEGSGQVSSGVLNTAPTSFTAYSDFTTESGAISGDSLTTGGTWTSTGAATDFSVAAGVATRTAVSDTVTSPANGRLITASSSSGTNQGVRATVITTAGLSTIAGAQGVIFRYVDASNFGCAVVYAYTNQLFLQIITVIGGASVAASVGSAVSGPTSMTSTIITAVVDSFGRVVATATQGGATLYTATLQNSNFATGGTLASGKAGIVDWWFSATAATRTYDNFGSWTPAADAALFASQSAEIRNDRVIREDSGGTLWVTPSSYEGDYLLIPPAGAEARTNRFFVKGSRGIPGESADSGIDDISATLSFTPRFLVVP